MERTQAPNNNSGLFQDEDPGITLGTAIVALDQNNHQEEIANTIESAGIVLAVEQDQLSKAVSTHAAGADFYTDSGAANAYVLSPVLSFESPVAYFAGMRVRFIASATNTGFSTINVNSLGVKNIKTVTGSDPLGSVIQAGRLVEAFYDGTNFVIGSSTSNVYQTKFLPAARGTLGNMPELTFTLTAGKTYRISGQFRLTIGTSSTGTGVILKDDGVKIVQYDVNNLSGEFDTQYLNPSFIHTMVGTTLTVDSNASSGDFINGDGTLDETFLTVEEAPFCVSGIIT